MWKYFLACGMLLTLFSVSSAQIGAGLNAYAGGGLNLPLEDVKDSWKPGGHGAVAVGYPLTPGLEGVGRYGYYVFPVEDNPDTVSFADTDDDLTIHEFAAEIHAQLTPPRIKLRPYGLIGLGAAAIPNRTEFFYCVGGGFKYSIAPKISAFVEGRYSWISVEDFSVNYIPITVGVNVSL